MTNSNYVKGKRSFESLYKKERGFLVFLTSKECGPCFRLKPQLERTVKETGVKLVEIDSSNREICELLGSNGTPIVFFIKNKVILKKIEGCQNRCDYKDAIKEFELELSPKL
tara:strand:+ start:56 stop:391 length:336 start_codon:yes stop_codon:yes gene_type:complete